MSKSTPSSDNASNAHRSGTNTLREWLTNLFGWVLKRGWIEVQAEVQGCTPVRSSFNDIRLEQGGYLIPLGGYIVSFTYEVGGRTYVGSTNSPDPVVHGDKFAIRCNPKNPDANNTVDSETNFIPVLTWMIWTGILLVIAGYYVWNRFAQK